MYASDKKAVVDALRMAGVSPTSQRVEIAYHLYNRQEHLSADQILEGVNGDYPAVSRGTVYNALNLLVEKGLVRELIAAPGKVFYDPNTHPHHHIFYVDQGVLMDLPAEMVQVKNIPVPEGCEIEQIDVVVRVRG
ncbi:MAG: transcriptional repressor [Magnetococcales bacterium]|nr:transcriptional repressor [Magnetococcales bacterium]